MKRQNEPSGPAPTAERREQATRPAATWLGGLAAVFSSTVGAVCPACIPALESLLASLGLGFAAKEQFLQLLLIALLSLGIGSLANFRVKRVCNRCGGINAFPAQPARDATQP